MPLKPTTSNMLLLASALATAPISSGCSGNSSANAPKLGLRCVDDSNHCISQRKMVLDSYMADPSRRWMKEQPTPHAYASGVRLFAMSKQRRSMSCAELRQGKQEADAGPSVLRAPNAQHLSPAQRARGVMLAGEVSRELGRELRRRCR